MQIETLRLQTACPDALVDFYGGTFGLVAERHDDGSVAVTVGETTVEFEPVAGTTPVYHVAFDAPPNQFDEAVVWLSDRVDPLEDPDTGARTFFFEFMDAHAVYCLDPAGNVLELVARGGLPGESGVFNAESLRRVSEVGVPTPQFEETVRALERAVGATRWPKSSDEFAVVGDDQGMFIVVETGRPWYPTDTPASDAFPVTVRTPAAVESHTFDGLPYRVEPA